nr:hypothetical protein [Tanacetum cinerariifolium]
EAVNKEMDDSLERAATTAASLDAECQETMGDTVAQTRVLDLETTMTTQALEIDSLKKRAKKLKRRKRSRTYGLKRLYMVGLSARVESSKDKDMFGVNDLDGDGVIVESVDVVDQAKEVVDDIILAKALMEIKSAKPKADKFLHNNHNRSRTKKKEKMVEPEPIKKLSKKDQLMLDEELPFKLKAKEEEEEERLAKEKAQQIEEVNIAWDDVQAKINVDYELAQRLQVEEQEELTDAKKEKLFMQFLEKRRKFFAAKRAEEKRNRPPTRAQQRSIMCIYLKNIEGWKLKSLKNNSKKAKAKVPQGSSKRAGEELEQENTKKQKMEDDKESAELKQCLEIILDDGDDVIIDATPLSSKSPTIIDYKIYKEGRKSYFQIFRADGNSQMYLTFSKMHKNFNREDLEVF